MVVRGQGLVLLDILGPLLLRILLAMSILCHALRRKDGRGGGTGRVCRRLAGESSDPKPSNQFPIAGEKAKEHLAGPKFGHGAPGDENAWVSDTTAKLSLRQRERNVGVCGGFESKGSCKRRNRPLPKVVGKLKKKKKKIKERVERQQSNGQAERKKRWYSWFNLSTCGIAEGALGLVADGRGGGSGWRWLQWLYVQRCRRFPPGQTPR